MDDSDEPTRRRTYRISPRRQARDLEIVRMRELDQVTYEEIGARYGMTRQGGRQAYFRARSRVRKGVS